MSSKLNLPPMVHRSIESMIDGPITKITLLPGGNSYPAYVVKCRGEDFFLKLSNGHTDVFIKEAQGLRCLSQEKPLTPEIYLVDNHCLFLEYLPPHQPSLESWKNLAQNLAHLHEIKNEFFGYQEDNFIGQSIQYNQISSREMSWFDFFWNYRIVPQLEWANERHDFKLDNEIYKRLKFKIKQQLSDHLFTPSLVHGDLWSGNILCSKNQKTYFIDPAVYYGDREVDIAMTHLFGGFADSFYKHYNSLLPLRKDSEKREVIYNLYHRLNHYNLFGSSYKEGLLKAVQQITEF